MTKFEEYREQYSEFVYRGYHYTIGADLCGEHPEEKLCRIVYDFETPGLSEFHPTWTFPVRRELDTEAKKILEELIFQLGLAETISYYKITCPKKVRIECGTLTGEQRTWWRKLYYNGLGEFMYRNGIEVSEEELLTIECPSPEEQGVRKPFQDPTEYQGFLVPVGGGKDSVVTLETLRGQDIMTYHINDDSAIDEVIEVFNHTENDCRAKRTLDPNMLELNRKGYLNGHTPFSAIVAFSSTAAAFLSGRRMIALSNETSANETTVRGSFVNHQYSKSYEFEQDFQNYIGQITTSDIHYFSFLRPLAEIEIAALFAQCRDYHRVFLSCNRGSKKGIWCCDCPKCLFVYIILSPFLTEEELVGIFGEKLLDKPSLEKDFRELVGIDENKPFECVGTRSEVGCALKAFVEKGGRSLLTDRYREEILGERESLAEYLNRWEDRNHVPSEYQQILKEKLAEAREAALG